MYVPEEQKCAWMVHFVNQDMDEVYIYVATSRSAEILVEELKKLGVSAERIDVRSRL